MKQQKTTMSRAFLARALFSNGLTAAGVLKTLKQITVKAHEINKPGWVQNAAKLWQWLLKPASKAGAPPFTMFTLGNSKLPFISWSTLPGINCPGAGACWKFVKGILAGWCYSVKAWRYPAAFMRQLQNTLLERGLVFRQIIHADIERILEKTSGAVTLRLYVDGDFSSVEVLKFWMDTLKKYPRLNAYGYSKSLHLFEELDKTGYIWPKNYSLNMSSGGIHEHTKTGAYVRNMAIYRGDFIAVNVSAKTLDNWNKQTLTKQDRREIRSKVNASKVFICPKYCGECTLIKDNPHACGNREKFGGVSLVIPVH